MKLKFFNASNLPSIMKGVPQVRISKAGAFSFNIPAGQILGLTKESRIELAQDEENPSDWYLIVRTSDNNDAFPVRVYKEYKDHSTYMFSNSTMAKTFMEAIKADSKTAALNISIHSIDVEGMQLFPVITSSFQKNQIRKAA